MRFKDYMLYGMKIFISCFLSVSILSLFSYQFYYFGLNRANPTHATDFVSMPNQTLVQRQEGFAVSKTDKNGYNNAYTPKAEKIDILLMGSSQAKGQNVSPEKNMGYLLNDLLPDFYTYSIAEDSHTLYTNVQNINYAIKEYPTRYVVLQTNTIELSCDDMHKVCLGKYEKVQLDAGPYVDILKKYLPVSRLVFNQMKRWLTDDEEPIEEDFTGLEYKNMLDAFLKKTIQTQKKIIIFYHPTTKLDKSGNMINTTNPDALSVFREVCEKNGIVFVDMTKDFEKLYYEEHHLPYGFINTSLGEGHLNEYGHRVIAERLAEVIRSLETQKEAA